MEKVDGRTKEGKAAKLKASTDTPIPEATVLQEAHALIYGDREADYGHPAKNLGDIAKFWQVYLESKYGVVLPLDAEDVCQAMVLLKMARGFNGPKKRDTVVDMAGYVGLMERVQG